MLMIELERYSIRIWQDKDQLLKQYKTDKKSRYQKYFERF